MDIRPVEICPLVWFDIFGSNLHVFVRCRVGELSWTEHPELGALLVTLFSDIFRIQGTLHSASIRHPIWFALSGTIVFFSTGQLPNTPSGCVRAIWPIRRVMECCISYAWPPQSPDLNPIEMVWDELDRRVKEKQPTSTEHMWELLQDCWKSIPGEAGWENAKSVQSCHQGKGWLHWRI